MNILRVLTTVILLIGGSMSQAHPPQQQTSLDEAASLAAEQIVEWLAQNYPDARVDRCLYIANPDELGYNNAVADKDGLLQYSRWDSFQFIEITFYCRNLIGGQFAITSLPEAGREAFRTTLDLGRFVDRDDATQVSTDIVELLNQALPEHGFSARTFGEYAGDRF